MLSSQTKDEVTDAAMTKLRAAVGGTLSVAAIISADDATISDAIAKVGFWRRKTVYVYFYFDRMVTSYTYVFYPRYVKKAALRLRDDFDSDVPKTVDELCSLPGVGPKMAFLTLQVAWNLYLVFYYTFDELSDAPAEISVLAWMCMFTVLQIGWGGINGPPRSLKKPG